MIHMMWIPATAIIARLKQPGCKIKQDQTEARLRKTAGSLWLELMDRKRHIS